MPRYHADVIPFRVKSFIIWILAIQLCLLSICVEAWQDTDIDFEFEDPLQKNNQVEADDLYGKSYGKWSKNVMCRNLQCKEHQTCVVKSQNVAVCVSKKKLQNYGIGSSKPKHSNKYKPEKIKTEFTEPTEDPREWPDAEKKSCEPCPVVKPEFVCGSDNQTYSSDCRLKYHNCVHKLSTLAMCKGFCPCKDDRTSDDLQKEKRMKERWNNYMNKFHNTLNKLQKSTSDPLDTKSRDASIMNKSKIEVSAKVDDPSNNKAQQKKGCTREELKMMGDRLLDWFSVVMSDHQKPHSRRRGLSANVKMSSTCKQEVKWMFHHLDSDSDMKLSFRELYDLEHDEKEHCLQPYLADCDANRDLYLSHREWCSCYEKSKRPCIAAQDRAPAGLTGTYMPQCDEDGYYLPRQCHNSVGLCWCVDQHGVEFTNTRRRGHPDCDGLLRHQKHTNDDEDDSDDDSDEEEGSADKPLDI